MMLQYQFPVSWKEQPLCKQQQLYINFQCFWLSPGWQMLHSYFAPSAHWQVHFIQENLRSMPWSAAPSATGGWKPVFRSTSVKLFSGLQYLFSILFTAILKNEVLQGASSVGFGHMEQMGFPDACITLAAFQQFWCTSLKQHLMLIYYRPHYSTGSG